MALATPYTRSHSLFFDLSALKRQADCRDLARDLLRQERGLSHEPIRAERPAARAVHADGLRPPQLQIHSTVCLLDSSAAHSVLETQTPASKTLDRLLAFSQKQIRRGRMAINISHCNLNQPRRQAFPDSPSTAKPAAFSDKEK